jgi:hemerythrin superfamily protein
MATPQTPSTKSTKPARTAETVSVKRFDGKTTKQPLAVGFLMQQHRNVETLFDDYENTENSAEKSKLTEKICLMLAVHAKIEEELLYPAAQDQIEEPDLVDEANVEHATAKDLIAQIETMQVGDDLYDAKVKVLGEYIAHHVKEEETELFPQVKKTDMDLTAIGARLKTRAVQIEKELKAGGRKSVAKEAAAGAHI